MARTVQPRSAGAVRRDRRRNGGLLALGIEPLAFGEVDAAAPYTAPQRFFAVWCAPDRASLDALLAGIAASGWHGYFATVNAAGAISDLAAHLGQLEA
ncbi:DUF6616 family protein [Rhodopseudomonas sp. BR0C11]|uniref:DUF6616 family protein n=1 Tax=Rhodopseudomonas sp. BR0C11 TaxID=2269370 RepID=UPI0032DFE949